MTVYRDSIEGGANLRIQSCKETIALQFETPLKYGFLHSSYTVLLNREDAIKVKDFLTKAINEIEGE